MMWLLDIWLLTIWQDCGMTRMIKGKATVNSYSSEIPTHPDAWLICCTLKNETSSKSATKPQTQQQWNSGDPAIYVVRLAILL